MSSESSQSGHLCRLRTKHLWPALALLSLSLGACEVEDLSKQINSASRLKVLAILINEHKQNHGEISAVSIKSIAEKESFQADLWGHEMAVLVRDESFLIVYPGRDGKFDVDDIARYFNQDQVNVTGMYDHDLVVENRHLLTIVGKEVPERFPKRPLIPGKLP